MSDDKLTITKRRGDLMNKSKSKVKLVAEAAGVSVMTVSRVINNKKGFSEETKKRVLDAIELYDYHPNPIARSLVTKKSKIIGLIIYSSVEENNLFFYEIMIGIQIELNKYGYDLLLYSQQDQNVVERVMKTKLVDGIILMGNIDQKHIVMLKKNGLPFVVVGRREIEGVDVQYVAPQYTEGVKEGINHLISLGHKKIGFIGAIRTFEPDYDKLLGYQTALFENQIPFNPMYVKEINDQVEESKVAMTSLLELNVTAVFFSSSNCINGGYAVIKEQGIKIPDDLSIMGLITADTVSQGIRDELTQILIPKKNVGMAVACKLLGKIEEEFVPDTVSVKLNFVEKKTCKPIR